ncbi:hypothetical protein GJAV_G00210300 [Gymnothorax javanicus]|nr:hypothetical protein GJAV_G00210300 [Gymnothorax javanicus]
MGQRIAIVINLLWMSFFTSQILAEDVLLYGLVDGEVMLIPEPFSEKLNRILWKHGEHKAAEWEPDALEYFRIFKGAASLNETSGTLALRNLNPKFDGFYSAEINGKPSTKRSNLIVINRASKPSIEKRCNESVCMLSCKTTPSVEDRYSWMEDEEDMGIHNSDLKLVKSDEVLDKAYKCNYSNPLSYALSERIVPFRFDVRVPKPSIEKRCNESVCTLSCKTTPTIKDRYTWMEDGKDIGNRDSDLKLVKSDKVLDKAYKCNHSNPLSYALSDEIVPFPSDGPNIGQIVGGIVAVIAIIAIAVIVTKYGKELGLREIWQRISKGRTSENPRGNPEAGANGAAAEQMLPKGETTGSKETAS